MAVRLRARATTLLRVALLSGAVAPFAAIGLLLYLVRSPFGTARAEPVPQPVEFDHRHHAGDDAIDCRYCHSTVEKSSTAGYPSTATCLRCHSQIWNRSALLDPVRAAYFENRAIPWRRVYQLPDFVFFDHSIHVNKGVGCIECHGRVDLMAAVWQVGPLTMSWCLDCHRDPGPHLRPVSEITSMEWRRPAGREGAALAARLVRAYDVHPRTDCTTCHR